MRIGEVLLAHGWVDPATLTRVVAEQRHLKMRLCSMLVARGMLDFDNASRALSEQHGIPGALSKHLDGRDPLLANILPPELGRANVVLPIGRMRDGKLIIAVRDPRPNLIHTIEAATNDRVMLAVTPAARLEQLVIEAYGSGEDEEFDVDLHTGPIAVMKGTFDPLDVDAPQFTLAALDDARVAKDPSQSGSSTKRDSTPAMPPRSPGGSQPPPNRKISDSIAPTQAIPRQSSRNSAVGFGTPTPPSAEETRQRLDRAQSRDEATAAAMGYLEGRFVSALMVSINEGAALGHRGHGPAMQAVETIALPMASPSMVKTVHDTQKATNKVPPGAIQERLSRLLGDPHAPAAAPLIMRGRVIGAIVVGDPQLGTPEQAFVDLDWVADALGAAYARILVDSRR